MTDPNNYNDDISSETLTSNNGSISNTLNLHMHQEKGPSQSQNIPVNSVEDGISDNELNFQQAPQKWEILETPEQEAFTIQKNNICEWYTQAEINEFLDELSLKQRLFEELPLPDDDHISEKVCDHSTTETGSEVCRSGVDNIVSTHHLESCSEPGSSNSKHLPDINISEYDQAVEGSQQLQTQEHEEFIIHTNDNCEWLTTTDLNEVSDDLSLHRVLFEELLPHNDNFEWNTRVEFNELLNNFTLKQKLFEDLTLTDDDHISEGNFDHSTTVTSSEVCFDNIMDPNDNYNEILSEILISNIDNISNTLKLDMVGHLRQSQSLSETFPMNSEKNGTCDKKYKVQQTLECFQRQDYDAFRSRTNDNCEWFTMNELNAVLDDLSVNRELFEDLPLTDDDLISDSDDSTSETSSEVGSSDGDNINSTHHIKSCSEPGPSNAKHLLDITIPEHDQTVEGSQQQQTQEHEAFITQTNDTCEWYKMSKILDLSLNRELFEELSLPDYDHISDGDSDHSTTETNTEVCRSGVDNISSTHCQKCYSGPGPSECKHFPDIVIPEQDHAVEGSQQQDAIKNNACGFCDKSFVSETDCETHSFLHITEEGFLKCLICSEQYYYEENLNFHSSCHKKSYLCKVRGKGFKLKMFLNGHIRKNTSVDPYICETCGKRFKKKDALNQHKLTHTSEKPYICEVCRKGFTYISVLITHKRTHTGEKPYVCDFCEKGFAQKSNLDRHRRIHIGEKPYVCEICFKQFRQSTHLNFHRRTHLRNN